MLLLHRVVWWLGTAVVGVMCAAAALQLAATLADVWREFPGPPGLAGIGLLAGLSAASALLAWLALRGSGWTRRFLRLMPWSGLAVLVGLRVAAMLVYDAPLSSDPLFQHRLAVAAAADEQGPFAHRPMGYPLILGAAYRLLGVEVWVAELTNLLIAAGAGAALYAFTRAAWGPLAAGIALTLYAVAPSQVLLTLPTLTEPTYAALLLAAAWAAVAARDRLAGAALVGLLLGASQYVRPLSQALLLAFVALPFVAGAPLRWAGARAAVLLALFAVAVAPVAAHNYLTYGDLSVSTSAYAGWSLFVGANQEHDGVYNPDDAEVLADQPGDSWWARSRAIGPLGVERITGDPRGFAELVVRKFWVMWADEGYGVVWALRGGVADSRVVATLRIASQAAWVAVLAAAMLALLGGRRRPSHATLLVLMLVLLVSGIHAFVEVQGRYHAYLVPFVVALAASWVAPRLSSPRSPAARTTRAA